MTSGQYTLIALAVVVVIAVIAWRSGVPQLVLKVLLAGFLILTVLPVIRAFAKIFGGLGRWAFGGAAGNRSKPDDPIPSDATADEDELQPENRAADERA